MTAARALVADATNRLSKAGVPSPSVDAAELLAFVLGTTRGRLLLHDQVSDEDARRFERLVVKRMTRVPLQHIIGTAAFRWIELEVGPGVFVPRPETELLVEIAVRHIKQAPEPVVVDLCAGSGAIALAIANEVSHATVHAVEVSTDAWPWLQRNAAKSQSASVHLHHADATHPELLHELDGTVDVVVTNPPYIPDDMVPVDPEVALHDPRRALFGGPDGLDVVRGLIPIAHRLLKPAGLLVIEHADVQGKALPELLISQEWTQVVDHQDLNGRPRATVATKVQR